MPSDEVMGAIQVAIDKHAECGFKLHHGRFMRGVPIHMNSEFRKVTIQESDGSGRTFYLSAIEVYDWPVEVMEAMGHSKKLPIKKTDWRSVKRRAARGGPHPENPDALKAER